MYLLASNEGVHDGVDRVVEGWLEKKVVMALGLNSRKVGGRNLKKVSKKAMGGMDGPNLVVWHDLVL